MANAPRFTSTTTSSPFGARSVAMAKSSGCADDRLRRAVLARLIADPLVRTGHIRVTAEAGAATLGGYVTSGGQKEAAIAAAQRAPGVYRVVDALTVALPCPAETTSVALACPHRMRLGATARADAGPTRAGVSP